MQLEKGKVLRSKTCEYTIEKTLGQGSFGITYKAVGSTRIQGPFGEIEVALPNPVAIKEFYMKDINSRSDDGTLQGMTEGGLAYNYALKFRKEAERLAVMNHPGIIKVIDFIEANNTFYYVMEFVDGVDVNHYMKNAPLKTELALDIFAQVAAALTYMHDEHKMLHLDLKPGNIMYREDGHVFLIDFGLSKHFSDEGIPDTSTTIGLGTEGYAPLEQGKNSATQNNFRPTIDVYALGATLFKMLTGETPPSASDVLDDDELLYRLMTSHGVTSEIRDVVIDAMNPIAKKRIPTVAAMAERLGVIMNGKESEDTIVDLPAVEPEMSDEDTVFGLQEVESVQIDAFPIDEWVDLGLSVKWRSRNLGALKINDFGDMRDYDYSAPSRAQFKELMDNCEWKWVCVDGVKGYKVTGRNGNSIFLPASGKLFMGTKSNINEKGYYWSSTEHMDDSACYLFLDHTDHGLFIGPKCIQRTVRLVK